MMLNATTEKMRSLKLWGMLEGLEEQMSVSDMGQMSFEDRLSLLVDREDTLRRQKRTSSRLKAAKLKDSSACLEDIDFKIERGLEKGVILSLANCEWIKQHQNIVFVGPTGVGKGYVSSALIQRACMEGYTARFCRISRLLSELAMAKVDGRYYKMLAELASTDVIILDDFGQKLSEGERRDLFEIIEDRYGTRSTIITTQIPIEDWPAVIGEPTIADAVMDRLIHNAHKINLSGPSVRKIKGKVTI